MNTLPKIREMVRQELLKHPETRDDDFLLVARIYYDFYKIDKSRSFILVMVRHKELRLPSFESIRRNRQYLQAEKPNLYGASEEVMELRHQGECDYYDNFKK